MNGFIGALAAQLALKPVSPAADGIAPRPRRPVAECLRAQRTARAKLTAPSRRSAYLQQLRRVWWADSAAVRMRARVAAARPRPSRSRARAVTTLRRVASQQPMAPAPQVGRTSMRRRTQRTARADAPPVLQVGGAHQCPSHAPPPVGRARQCPGSFIAAAPTAASRGWARAGYGGNEHAAPCTAEGWLCWRYAAAVRHRAVGHGGICPRIVFPGGRRIATCARNALSAVRRRQGAREMHSQAPGGGDMLTLCVPGCLTMTIFCPGVSQKRPRTGKGPLRGNISPPCIQNELALARYARHASEKPRKLPSEDTPREDFARKEPFSLHKPLESCTARSSCLPCARPCARKARGAGYRKCTSYCGRRPHHRGCAHLRQPCATTAAAALWPVA